MTQLLGQAFLCRSIAWGLESFIRRAASTALTQPARLSACLSAYLPATMKLLIILTVGLLLCTVILSAPAPAIKKPEDCKIEGMHEDSINACKESLAKSPPEDPCKNVGEEDKEKCKAQRDKPADPNAPKSTGAATAPGTMWAIAIFAVMGVNAML